MNVNDMEVSSQRDEGVLCAVNFSASRARQNKAQFGLDFWLVDSLDQPLTVNLAPTRRLGRKISETADDRRLLFSVPGCRIDLVVTKLPHAALLAMYYT